MPARGLESGQTRRPRLISGRAVQILLMVTRPAQLGPAFGVALRFGLGRRRLRRLRPRSVTITPSEARTQQEPALEAIFVVQAESSLVGQTDCYSLSRRRSQVPRDHFNQSIAIGLQEWRMV